MRPTSALLGAVGLAATGVLWSTSAASPPESPAPESGSPTFEWRLPPGFPRPVVPPDNPMSAAKVELGRYLFYDHRLSSNGHARCATCHRQELAFTDGLPRAVGTTGEAHPRGSMSLANVAYNASYAWADPGLRSLEAQAHVPMFNRDPVELGLEGDGDAMLARLAEEPSYAAMFAEAFGEPAPGEAGVISLERVVQAIAAFERTLISGGSAYDRRVYFDEREAMSPSARRGMRLFFSDRMGCFRCHSGFNFSGPVNSEDAPDRELDFHNTGLYNLGEQGFYPERNNGVFEHTGQQRDVGTFRAPTLRNVALTAPYMHDGSIATLSEVVDHYAAGGRTLTTGPYAGVGHDNPRKSPLITGFLLAAGEREDLVAFLHSLTDPGFVTDPRFSDPFAEADGSDPLFPVRGFAARPRPLASSR